MLIRLEAYFFQTEKNVEPVKKWLKDLSKKDKRIIGEDIRTVQYGWPIGMPLVRNLGHGLWEIRSTLSSNRIARIIFFIHNNSMILLNGFIKKTQATPKTEIELALQRKRKFGNLIMEREYDYEY